MIEENNQGAEPMGAVPVKDKQRQKQKERREFSFLYLSF